MLLKVISVDDELLVRNHLRSLINWENFGFTFCGEACDGNEGLQLISMIKPHLAIVDMNMPGMGGVELVRQIAELHPQVRIIALSSYDSYDYVRGSLHYGAMDYLLKHSLSPSTLIPVLSIVKEKVHEELAKQTARDRERLKWESASPAVSQSYLKELLIGAGTLEERCHYAEHFQDMPYGRDDQLHVLFLMKLMHVDSLSLRMNEQEFTLYVRSITDMAMQIVGDSGCAVYLEKGTFGVLFSLENERSEYAMQQRIEAKKSRLDKSLELYFNAAGLVVRSPLFDQIASISDYYAELRNEMDKLQGYKPNVEKNGGGQASFVTLNQEKELLAAAEAYDAEATSRIIRDVATACAVSGHALPQRVASTSAELFQLAVKIAQKAGIDAEWIFQEMKAGLPVPQSAQAFEQNLIALYVRLIEELRVHDTSARYTRYVGQAVRIIQQLYSTGITLEETAEQLRITSPYLSRLFKEETGSTFTEYMTAYRIDRSAQLIRTGVSSIKEIYQQVGFNNYSYFIKLFKEHMGETPHVYANKHNK
ncbi:response regulator [Paenibacillus sp. CGMCC 1.16610]|uniref:Response regulator n=1 Tax=Paenibacillus anseongense TaxID=2682845 RepID=A0ABW9UHK5_9BACL|nr:MULTISPECIES: response regulator [Paenibacillus]MBA2938600.1 response regulator [Paenibacillus sp. CGMCC 1.16610]MVQ38791.1 response regulator [Paenibacillus anseongense]